MQLSFFDIYKIVKTLLCCHLPIRWTVAASKDTDTKLASSLVAAKNFLTQVINTYTAIVLLDELCCCLLASM